MTEKKPRKAERWYGCGDSIVDLEELNIVEFPLALLARQIPAEQKEVRFSDTIKDHSTREWLNRTCTISANANTRLPNWWDQDVFVAMQVLTNRKNGWKEPVVEFSIYELLLLMRLKDEGRNIKRVAESLDNWQGLRVKYSHWRVGDSWTNPKAFGFIQDYDLTRKGRRTPDHPQVYTWSRIFFESIQASNTKPFDSDFYFNLQLPTSRRMFRLLDKRFWNRATYNYPLVPFCTEKLGLSRTAYKKPTEYRRKIEPAYNELVTQGFLANLDNDKRYPRDGKGVEISFRRGRKKKSNVVYVGRTDIGLDELAKTLRDKGVSVGVAVDLVESQPEDVIRYQLEHLAWLESQGKAPPRPGGWLNKAITENWKAPSDFKTKAEREASKRAKRQKELEEFAAKETERAAVERQQQADRETFERFVQFRNTFTEAEQIRIEDEALERSDNHFLVRSIRTSRKEGKGTTLMHQILWEKDIMPGLTRKSEEPAEQPLLFDEAGRGRQ